jgi:hypothetical protein
VVATSWPRPRACELRGAAGSRRGSRTGRAARWPRPSRRGWRRASRWRMPCCGAGVRPRRHRAARATARPRAAGSFRGLDAARFGLAPKTWRSFRWPRFCFSALPCVGGKPRRPGGGGWNCLRSACAGSAGDSPSPCHKRRCAAGQSLLLLRALRQAAGLLFAALEGALLGRSHRAPAPKARLAR